MNSDPFYPIGILSLTWWAGMAFFGLYAVALARLSNAAEQRRIKIERILGYALATLYLGVHAHQIINGVWSTSVSLPGHLCSISFILALSS